MVTLKQIEEQRGKYYFPKAFENRLKIASDDIGKRTFSMDAEIIVRATPAVDEKTKEPIMNKDRTKQINDRTAYLPIVLDDEPETQYCLITSSPAILKLVNQIGFCEFEDDQVKFPGSKLQICSEILEGKLKLSTVKHDYGSKGKYDVLNIEDAA